MSNISMTLMYQPGHVFETDKSSGCWTAGSATEGLWVDGGPRVNQVLVEFSFVLPQLSADDPGCYPIFGLARGVPVEPACEPDCWFPCAGTDDGTGGVFLHVTYEPAKGLIHCAMNAGTPRRELHCLSLGPASPEHYTGRVLRAFILVAPSGLYPSIEDAAGEEAELFGELLLPRFVGASGYPPWGVAPTGNWYVNSGVAIQRNHGEEMFPPGFGLSDVRIHLVGSADEDFGMLPYSGDLDHLASDPFVTDDWAGEDEEVPFSELLRDFAAELAGLAGDAAQWADRALDLADETEDLADETEDLADETEEKTFFLSEGSESEVSIPRKLASP